MKKYREKTSVFTKYDMFYITHRKYMIVSNLSNMGHTGFAINSLLERTFTLRGAYSPPHRTPPRAGTDPF